MHRINPLPLRPNEAPIKLQRWSDLSAAQKSQVRLLAIDAQQVEYAGTAERAIENVESDTQDDVAGIAILKFAEIVGFLVLKRRSKAPAWASTTAAVVSAMRIDLVQQGLGIGSEALIALSAWILVNWSSATELALSVDEENKRGIAAYTRAGFVDQGQREQGRIGWVRYMKKQIVGVTRSAA